MKPNGTTPRTAASSGAPRGADLAELAQERGPLRNRPPGLPPAQNFPPTHHAARFWLAYRHKVSPVGWSAAALLIRRRTPKRRTRSRCYGPSTDSVSVKLIKKVCWFNTGDGKDAETALSSRNFPRIIIGRCRVHCWFMVYTRGGHRRASVKGSRDPLLPKAHPHCERSYTLDAAPTRDGAPDPGSRKIAVGLHTEVRFGTTSVSPS